MATSGRTDSTETLQLFLRDDVPTQDMVPETSIHLTVGL